MCEIPSYSTISPAINVFLRDDDLRRGISAREGLCSSVIIAIYNVIDFQYTVSDQIYSASFDALRQLSVTTGVLVENTAPGYLV